MCDSRSRYSIEQLLCFRTNTLALLHVLLLHLANRVIFTCLQRGQIHLGDAGQCAIETRCRLSCSLSCSNDLERFNVRERNDVVIARLAENGGGGVRRSRCGVDRYGVGDVASRKKGAFKDVLARGTCDFDAGVRQLLPQ